MEPAGEYLRGLIRANGGVISVEHLMREALYHPQYGYYVRRVRDVGARGDFSTSVTLDPALPRAVARWAQTRRPAAGGGSKWHLIELGGGSGEMAAGVLGALGWMGRRGLTYHVVEISAPLRSAQQRRTADFARRILWHGDISAALLAAGGRALIISNEFVDAFPCVQLARDEGEPNGWREVALSWPQEAGAPVEIERAWQGAGPAWELCAASSAGRAAGEIAPRQRVEVHLDYARWLESMSAAWRAGWMLTIDYGGEFPWLYHRRPRGTLRGYLHHQRLTGAALYRHFGRQDLTADVNFSDLQRWGNAYGIETRHFGTQAGFLRKYLSRKELERAVDSPALSFLLDEHGAGGAFKVLEQGRD